MLAHLSIRNYALISQLDIEFERGLTIITGETGAGKSILLDALSLILGQRADSQVLQDKKQKCIVEGTFDIEKYSLKDFFRKHDLDYESRTIIRREINPSGNSRAFINDTPVSLQQLKELSLNLVDIHSQHESLSLNSSAFQFNVVDSFAGHKDQVGRYQTKFKQFQLLKKELELLLEKEQKSKLDKDYFQFQFDELNNAALTIGEQQELEEELQIQNNSEQIKKNIFDSLGALRDGDGSVLSVLKEIKKYISQATRFKSSLQNIEQRLHSATVELEDIAEELEKVQDEISFSPERMETVNDRLNLIYSLEQKHRVKTTEELLQLIETLAGKLNAIASLDNEIEELNSRLASEKSELELLALKISEGRKKTIPKIEKQVNEMLKDLGMPHGKIEILLHQPQLSNGEVKKAGLEINNNITTLSINGIDEINFLFTANKGSSAKEIDKIASGGELSRLMLSVKSIIAQLTSLPTIIFDEIDTGVSGEIADKVGLIMQKMAGKNSSNMQVISITHLPQIASKGNVHFYVYKETAGSSTRTLLKKLSEKERIDEVARMLSGEELTKAAILNAKELLKK